MAINIPLVHISDLTEKKTISDDDYMLTGGSTASKVKWSTIVSLIKTKLGIGNIENNISKIQSDISTLNSDLTATKNTADNANDKLSLTNIGTLTVKWETGGILGFYVDGTRVVGIVSSWGSNIN